MLLHLLRLRSDATCSVLASFGSCLTPFAMASAADDGSCDDSLVASSMLVSVWLGALAAAVSTVYYSVCQLPRSWPGPNMLTPLTPCQAPSGGEQHCLPT